MKLKITLAILGVITIVLLGVFFFKPSTKLPTAESGSISSDDGIVVLEIPKGALPSGVKASDISISKMSEDEESGVIYDLQPSGLVFNEPVDLQITIPQETDVSRIATVSIPVVYLTSEDGEKNSTEIPKDIIFEYVLDEDGNSTGTLKGKIEHFTRLTVNNQTFMLYISNVGNRFVDVPFTSHVVISQLNNRSRENVYDHPLYRAFIQEYETWVISNGTLSTTGPLTPEEYTGVPEGAGNPTETPRGQAYIISRDFTCTEVGKAIIQYDANLIYLTKYIAQDLVGNEIEYQERNYQELPISIISRGFCTLGTEGAEGKKTGLQGGGFLRVDPFNEKIGYGDFQVEVMLSETRVYVGQSFTATATVKDVTEEATSQIQFTPPLSADNYRVEWELGANFTATPPADPENLEIFRISTEAYGAEATRKQEIYCRGEGITEVSLYYLLSRVPPPAIEAYNRKPVVTADEIVIGSVECVYPDETEFKAVTPSGFTIEPSGRVIFDPY